MQTEHCDHANRALWSCKQSIVIMQTVQDRNVWIPIVFVFMQLELVKHAFVHVHVLFGTKRQPWNRTWCLYLSLKRVHRMFIHKHIFIHTTIVASEEFLFYQPLTTTMSVYIQWLCIFSWGTPLLTRVSSRLLSRGSGSYFIPRFVPALCAEVFILRLCAVFAVWYFVRRFLSYICMYIYSMYVYIYICMYIYFVCGSAA